MHPLNTGTGIRVGLTLNLRLLIEYMVGMLRRNVRLEISNFKPGELISFIMNDFAESDDGMHAEVTKDEASFTKYSPVVTLLLFAVGPSRLLTQAIFDTIETLIIASRFRNEPEANAMAIIGVTPLPILISSYIYIYFGQAVIAKISKVLATGNRELAARIVVDIFRCAIIACMVFPFCYVWCVKPLLGFVNCSQEILDAAYRFCLPVVFGTVFIAVDYVALNYLQSIGRPILTFLITLVGSVLQVLILTPLLCLGLKVSTDYLRIASVASQGIVGLALFVLIVRGKFSLPIRPRMFLECFVKDSFNALFVASPVVVLAVCYLLPPNVILRCMNSIDSEHSKEVSAVTGVSDRFYSICSAMAMTFGSGFLSPGSHALGRGDPKRMWKIFAWAALFGIIPVSLVAIIVISNPGLVASGFLSSESEIQYAKKMLPIQFYTVTPQTINVLCIMLFMALGNAWISSLVGILQCVFVCVGAVVLQHKVKHTWSLLYLYNVSDVMGCMIYMIGILIYIKTRKKMSMDEKPISGLGNSLVD